MDKFPVVLRIEARTPVSLGGMLAHAERKCRDLEHCDADRRDDTIWYDEVGPRDFAKAVKDEIAEMAKSNLENALEAMDKSRRFADHAKREKEGLTSPYRDAENGPLREVILTAKAEYFFADPDDPDPYRAHRTTDKGDRETVYLSRDKIKAFEQRGLEFFAEHFPGQVRHLRLDMDEEVPHFHALIMVTKVTNSKRRGRQINIVPSANKFIRNYVWAQDAAGKFFETIGLVRGERRAQARKEALELGLPAPEEKEHITPKEHRAKRAEAIRLLEVEAEYHEEAAYHEAEKIKREALDEASHIREEAKEIRDQATELLAKAETELERKKAEFDKALEIGCNAVDDGEIRFRSQGENDDEGRLTYGPNAPEESSERNSLKAAIQPALGVIKKYARRIWISEPAQCKRDIKADPSLVDVKVSYDPNKEPQSDDILAINVKVTFDKLQGLSKPMKRILSGIANVIATKVGKAAIKLAREQMRDEFETLKSYREQHSKLFGALPREDRAKLLSTERKFENMTSKAADPRDAEKRAREARLNQGEKR